MQDRGEMGATKDFGCDATACKSGSGKYLWVLGEGFPERLSRQLLRTSPQVAPLRPFFRASFRHGCPELSGNDSGHLE